MKPPTLTHKAFYRMAASALSGLQSAHNRGPDKRSAIRQFILTRIL
ncbi:hypothetical protein STBHUCCB_47540 [Salmonella enterica subsp. enterica serovar Typhi str. P-stx-12]|nr:hypothetical protein STBHUCCB_47540 [Salmonella enterica subsp. enterica serovar Typhi str. P-stx-12]AXR57325.1 hypothetical protein CJP42_0865 [Salmonella enterica subsp. enterica serovar Typhi]EDZ11674.1 conserved hypothetical protein [Salmonella enterica subsp. enterica serovar Saintpaul str. SARA29]QDX88720.1 hypothetical protein FORC93_2671 [Salmonella enterica subsp. enterica serovar Braenderup]